MGKSFVVPNFENEVSIRARAEVVIAGLDMPELFKDEAKRRLIDLGIQIGITAAQQGQLEDYERFVR